MWWGLLWVLLALLTAGAGFWTGKLYAERKQLLSDEQQSKQMDEIIHRHAELGRDECLRRLRRPSR